MPTFKLISLVTCPYVQRSLITLEEKGVAYEVVHVDLQNKPPWFLALSPTGRVPVLLVREGERETVLFESAVINEYLDAGFQYQFAVDSGVVPINKKAQARLAEDPLLSELLELDPDMINKELRLDYSKVNVSDWTDQWSRSVAK